MVLYGRQKKPYGYVGLGEVFVLIFFGYMATMGTVYTQTGRAPLAAWLLATGIGLIACALLMVNNIRDIPTDSQAGKRTLAVRLGEKKARWSYYIMLALATMLAISLVLWGYDVAIGFLGLLIWVVYLARPVIAGASGHDLLSVLRNTGLFELSYAVIIAGALVLTTFFPQWPWNATGWSILGISWGIWLIVEVAAIAIRSRRRSHSVADSSDGDTAESSDGADNAADDDEANSIGDGVTNTIVATADTNGDEAASETATATDMDATDIAGDQGESAEDVSSENPQRDSAASE